MDPCVGMLFPRPNLGLMNTGESGFRSGSAHRPYLLIPLIRKLIRREEDAGAVLLLYTVDIIALLRDSQRNETLKKPLTALIILSRFK